MARRAGSVYTNCNGAGAGNILVDMAPEEGKEDEADSHQ